MQSAALSPADEAYLRARLRALVLTDDPEDWEQHAIVSLVNRLIADAQAATREEMLFLALTSGEDMARSQPQALLSLMTRLLAKGIEQMAEEDRRRPAPVIRLRRRRVA